MTRKEFDNKVAACSECRYVYACDVEGNDRYSLCDRHETELNASYDEEPVTSLEYTAVLTVKAVNLSNFRPLFEAITPPDMTLVSVTYQHSSNERHSQ